MLASGRGSDWAWAVTALTASSRRPRDLGGDLQALLVGVDRHDLGAEVGEVEGERAEARAQVEHAPPGDGAGALLGQQSQQQPSRGAAASIELVSSVTSPAGVSSRSLRRS